MLAMDEAEDKLMRSPSPDAAAFATKYLIAKGDGRDTDAWDEILEQEASRLAEATAAAPSATDWRAAYANYEKHRAALERHERDVYNPGYAKWKAGELTKAEFDLIYDQNAEFEDRAAKALDAACDARCADLSELCEKVDFIEKSAGWDVEDWRRGVIADVRHLASS